MDNKVTYGLDQVYIAFFDENVVTYPGWEKPTHIPGAVKFAPTPQGQDSKFYADNGLYFSLVTNNGYTADLEIALFPKEVKARMFGWTIDNNGILIEVADGKPAGFALLGQFEGDAHAGRFVYYNCLAARSEKEASTSTESIEIIPEKVSLTITPIIISGRKIVKGTMEQLKDNLEKYNNFFANVTLPDF